MTESLDALIVDLLLWLGPTGRPYPEVMDAWRTSCPGLPVWEEANERGFVVQDHTPGQRPLVTVTREGQQWLAERLGDDCGSAS